MVSLPETDVEEDHGDAGLMISNNGYCCRLCSTCKRQKRVEILGVRVDDLRSSDMRKDLGKARQGMVDWTTLSVLRAKKS